MTPRHYNSLRWKLCAGCGTVIAQSRAICPHCHSYRFDPIEVPPMTKDEINGADTEWLKKLAQVLEGKPI